VVLTAGGFLFFKFWYTEDLKVWDLVPESAILIYESNNTVQNWNEIQQKAIWSNLEQIPFYSSVGTGIQLLDSLSGQQGHLDRLVQGKPFVFSIHRVGQEALDFMFFVQLDHLNDYDVLNKLVTEFKKRDDFKFKTRTYQDFTINEAVNQDYGQVFSYLVYKNYFVGSFTPVLVEDVIRKLSGQNPNSFGDVNPLLADVAKLENDQGNFYINNRKLQSLFSIFVDEQQSAALAPIKSLGQSTFLDLKLTDQQVLLTGFTVLEPGGNEYLYSLKGGQGAALGFRDLLPMDLSLLFHLSFQEATSWHSRLRSYWETHRPQRLRAYETLQQKYDWDPNDLFAVMGNEIAVGSIQTLDDQDPPRLLYLNFKDFNEGLVQLNRLAEQTSTDTLYVESYGGSEIRQISIAQFPQLMWGDLFGGFDQVFFMPYEQTIICSNSIQALKNLQLSVQAEETWGRSIEKTQFLERTLQAANLSMFVDLKNSWNIVEGFLSPSWSEYLTRHETVIKGFDQISWQFSDVGDKFFTSGILTYDQPSQTTPQVAQSFSTVQEAFTQSAIISRPFVVRNHNNGSREVVLQDSTFNLYQISSQGKLLWSDSLPSAIQGQLSQVDYYKNNKLQYLLATNQAVHIIDRNGDDIEGYPVSVPTETRLKDIRAIDYDNSKNYRIAATDDNGQIFLMDKSGKLLEGWSPKVMDDQLIEAPRHIRVRGKDCIIAVQRNGMVHIMNRRGQNYPGFPLDLKGPTHNPLYMEIGTSFANTYFTTINNGGLIMKFNLEGAITQREQLLKPSRDTQYRLCIDPLSKNYVISRQNANRLGILNRNGEVILEKDYLTSSLLNVQYYIFASNRNLYAVTDPVQQFTYFYDDKGVLINSMPIENGQDVGVIYFESQRKHNVYHVYDKKFSIASF